MTLGMFCMGFYCVSAIGLLAWGCVGELRDRRRK